MNTPPNPNFPIDDALADQAVATGLTAISNLVRRHANPSVGQVESRLTEALVPDELGISPIDALTTTLARRIFQVVYSGNSDVARKNWAAVVAGVGGLGVAIQHYVDRDSSVADTQQVPPASAAPEWPTYPPDLETPN